MMKNYPEYHRYLQSQAAKLSKEIPGPIGGFAQLHKAAVADGALSTKVKELISLAIAVAIRCDGCIAYHVNDALRAGASREEIVDAIGVAILMGGGPAMIYGCEALAALDQCTAGDPPRQA